MESKEQLKNLIETAKILKESVLPCLEELIRQNTLTLICPHEDWAYDPCSNQEHCNKCKFLQEKYPSVDISEVDYSENIELWSQNAKEKENIL